MPIYLDFSVIEKEGYEAVMNRIIYEDKNKLFNNVNNKTGSELISTGKDDPSYFFFIKKHCYSYENELRVLFFKRPSSISSNKDNSLKYMFSVLLLFAVPGDSNIDKSPTMEAIK